MKRASILASVLFLVLLPAFPAPEPAPEAAKQVSTWQNVVSNVLARPGSMQPGDVYSVGISRSDLKVTLHGIVLEPAFALTSFQLFRSTGKGSEIQLKGDLLLLPDELNPVMGRLIKGGMQITALHNHLVGESPHLMDLHYEGTGASGALAATLRDALALTKVPRYESASELLEDNLPPQDVRQAFDQVEQILGQDGTVTRRVLQFHFPRKDPVRVGKEELPPGMGACTCVNLQKAGPNELAATGEIVVVQEELMPVIQALRLGDMEVAAIHSYTPGAVPPLRYVHFWGKASPEKIATALRAALDQSAVKR